MVWDLPTRLFHWGFAVSIVGAYVSGERGDLVWHEYFGLVAVGLFVFRLLWGFFGHAPSRFADFLYAPAQIWRYIKSLPQAAHFEGHNPLGGLAVFAMLAVMGAVAITGLWTGDDVLYAAPLTALAPHWEATAGRWHIQLHTLVIPLIALHLLAVLLHRLVLKEKLVSRMVRGGTGAATSRRRTMAGLVLLAVCVGGALALTLLPR